MHKPKRVSFYLPNSEWASLKIHCVLTDSTMTELIRIAIKEKIKHLKDDMKE